MLSFIRLHVPFHFNRRPVMSIIWNLHHRWLIGRLSRANQIKYRPGLFRLREKCTWSWDQIINMWENVWNMRSLLYVWKPRLFWKGGSFFIILRIKTMLLYVFIIRTKHTTDSTTVSLIRESSMVMIYWKSYNPSSGTITSTETMHLASFSMTISWPLHSECLFSMYSCLLPQ